MKAAISTLVVTLFLGNYVWAADKHGGHEVEVGRYHLELVAKDKDLALYVRDQGDKLVDSKSIKASADVLSGLAGGKSEQARFSLGAKSEHNGHIH